MANLKQSLFQLVVAEERADSSFMQVRSSPASEAARWMLDEIYETFVDSDGNFLEQFQTTGFNARIFELYLFAYFLRTRLLVPRAEAVPDFLVASGDVTVAVEATTVNPSTSGVLATLGRKIGDLDASELAAYRRHELGIRYGSPLRSKLRKRYWELPDCTGKPLVLAIQAFHDEDALGMAEGGLASYLYGLESDWTRGADGSLVVEFNRIHSHQVGEKEIPSSFFDQPDAEHISAILFSNSGTIAKFSRMGFQSGAGNDSLFMRRRGYSLNQSPDASDPSFFSYSLDDPPLVESWGQGLVVIHNPKCLHPVPPEFFPDAAQMYKEGDGIRTQTSSWHPFTSHTMILHAGEAKALSRQLSGGAQQVGIEATSKHEFEGAVGRFQGPEAFSEDGWFCDVADGFRSVILHDRVSQTWGFVVFARDQYFDFHPVGSASSFPERPSAVAAMYEHIEERAHSPQRIFSR